jgi:hypothetical protein
MIAKQKIETTIDGLRYVVLPGETIPPAVAAYWKAANLEAKVRASDMLEPEPAIAAPAKVAVSSKAKDSE